MARNKLLFLGICAGLLMAACQKETSIDSSARTTNTDLSGTYQFISMHVIAQSSVELTGAGINAKTITNTEYLTKDNAGTIVITSNKIDATDMTYRIDTVVKGYVYEDGVLTDSMEFAFAFTLPPTSSSNTYKQIGSDSLYFEGGSPMNIGGNVTNTVPSGGKFTLTDNQFVLTSTFYQRKTETDQGVSRISTVHGKATAIWQKQ